MTFRAVASVPLARGGVVLCLVLLAASLVGEAPWAVRLLDRQAAHSASLHFDDREFAVGNSVYPDTEILYEARAWIPPDSTYRVVTGSAPIQDETALTLPNAEQFARYFLMPRHTSASSPWVVCVGCNVGAFPHATTVWTDDEGASLLRLGT